MQRARVALPIRGLCSWVLAVGLYGCGGGGGSVDVVKQPPPYSDAVCTAITRSFDNTGLIGVQEAFPYRFTQATAFVQHASGTWYVAEKQGVVYRFHNNGAASPDLTLDLQDAVDSSGDGGLLGLTLSPDGAKLYLLYTASPPYRSVVDEYTVEVDGTLSLNKAAFLEIAHDKTAALSGEMTFGPDGYLYIALGDSETSTAQDPSYYTGSILRLDPTPDALRVLPYSIPADNPYAASPYCAAEGCPELGITGLHQAGGLHFDPITHRLWLHDHGSTQDEIDNVLHGDNAGWPCFDGNTLVSACAGDTLPPRLAFNRSDISTLINGGIYRGKAIENLYGELIYADQDNGRIYVQHSPYENGETQTLLDSGMRPSAFGQDINGEWYFLDQASGKMLRLTDTSSTLYSAFPDKLSATGCADPRNPKQAVAGMIAYQINAPLWTDGAVKLRWMSLPEGEKINVESNGHWRFPIGSVLRKDFYLNNRIIETRLLARHIDGGWGVYSYAWDSNQTDAQLLPGGGEKVLGDQTWVFPSTSQCYFCHAGEPGRSLGPETAQFNRTVDHPNRSSKVNQLDLLVELGVLASKPAAPAQLVDITDTAKDINDRARAYLHANCGFCHQPGGNGKGDIDLRITTDFADMNICDRPPKLDAMGVEGARVLSPGQPEKSMISLRMHNLDETRMPPLGSKVVDEQGTTLIDAWISGMTGCQ